MTTLIHGDCTEIADQIKDGSVDFLLTDPPYNISNDGAKPVWIDKETGENKNTIHSQKFSESFDEDWDAVTHEQFLFQLTQWSEMWYKKVRKGGSFAVFISDNMSVIFGKSWPIPGSNQNVFGLGRSLRRFLSIDTLILLVVASIYFGASSPEAREHLTATQT